MAIVVGDPRILVPILVNPIEEAVGVFLRLVEPHHVELVAIAVASAKQTNAAVDVIEDEAAKIADKELAPGANRGEIVIRTGVGQLRFDEPFLKRQEIAIAARPLSHIGIDNAQLVSDQRVDVEDHVHLHPPIVRLERPCCRETDRSPTLYSV